MLKGGSITGTPFLCLSVLDYIFNLSYNYPLKAYLISRLPRVSLIITYY
jgi:hypothetical protein